MFIFTTGETAGEGVRRIMAEKFRENMDLLISLPADPIRAVHDIRKNNKRCRAVLRLAPRALGGKVFRREDAALRDLGRLLASSRDAAVLINTLDCFFPPADQPKEIASLRTALADAREIAYQVLTSDSALLSTMEEAYGEALVRWSGPAPELDWVQLGRGLKRSFKDARRKMVAAYDSPETPQKFHDFRKACKYLGYQSRLFEPFWKEPEGAAEKIKGLEQLAEDLGIAHDAVVLENWLKDHPPEKRLKASLASLRKVRKVQEAAAKPLARKLFGKSARWVKLAKDEPKN